MKNLKLLTIIVLLFSINCTKGSDNDKLKLISMTKEIAPYTTGYINSKGDTIIPIGKYVYCYTEVFDKIAIVLPKGAKDFIAIDRNEKELFKVLVMDNGPDIVREGMFRIKLNDKIGFANMEGNIIIKPIYDFALPFENGYARINYGGHIKLVGEYESIEGGKWGLINTKGETVLHPIYDRIYDTHTNTVEVIQNRITKKIVIK